MPEIALYPPSSRRLDALVLRDLDFRLHRRVVEIRDAWLSLRPYLDADVAMNLRNALRGTGLASDDLEARVQAAVLASAVAAKAAGRAGAATAVDRLPGGADSTAEVAWLEKVARAYPRSRRPDAIARLGGGRRHAVPGTVR